MLHAYLLLSHSILSKEKKTAQNLYSTHKKKCSLHWRCLKTLWNFKTNSTFLWLSSIIISNSNREFIRFYNENAHSKTSFLCCMPCLLNLVVSIRGICSSTLTEQTYKFKENYFVGCRSRSWNYSISFSLYIYTYIGIEYNKSNIKMLCFLKCLFQIARPMRNPLKCMYVYRNFLYCERTRSIIAAAAAHTKYYTEFHTTVTVCFRSFSGRRRLTSVQKI